MNFKCKEDTSLWPDKDNLVWTNRTKTNVLRKSLLRNLRSYHRKGRGHQEDYHEFYTDLGEDIVREGIMRFIFTTTEVISDVGGFLVKLINRKEVHSRMCYGFVTPLSFHLGGLITDNQVCLTVTEKRW